MAFYRVVALEKFLVKTTYEAVKASTPSEAIEKCKRGDEAYDKHSIEEGDDEWLNVESVVKIPQREALAWKEKHGGD